MGIQGMGWLTSVVLGLTSASTLGVGCGKGAAPEAGDRAADKQAAPSNRINQAQLQAFADGIKLAGYSPKGPAAVSEFSAQLVFTGAERSPGVETQLTLEYSPCDPVTCPTLGAATMAAQAPKLKDALSPSAKANPELVFETVELDFAGGKAFGTYTLFMSVDKTPDGGTTTLSANTVEVFFHDGRQLIRVQAQGKDFGADSQAVLVANTPRAELEGAARAGLEAAVKLFKP